MKSRGATTRQTRQSTSSAFYNENSEDAYSANYNIASITPDFIAENKPSDWDGTAPYMKIGTIGCRPVPFAITDLEREIKVDKHITVNLEADVSPSEFSHMQLYDNNGNELGDSYYKLSPTNVEWKKSTDVDFDLSTDAIKGLHDPMNTTDDNGINMYNGLYNSTDDASCSNKDELHVCGVNSISKISAGTEMDIILSEISDEVKKPFTETETSDESAIKLLKDIHEAYSKLVDTSDLETMSKEEGYNEYATRVRAYKECIDSSSSDSAIYKLNAFIAAYNSHLTKLWYLFDIDADEEKRNALTNGNKSIDPIQKYDNYTYIAIVQGSGDYRSYYFDGTPPQLLNEAGLPFSSLSEFIAEYGITELGFSEELEKLNTWLETQKLQNNYEANNIRYIAGLLWQMYAKRRAIESSKPAARTMYIDSNIALTSGNACINNKDSTPKIIPNLFNAIETLQEKTDRISKWAESHKHEPIPSAGEGELSTADKLLYVENYTEDYKTRTTIVPQKTSSSSGVTAGGSISDALRLRAGNIEFEIESPNTTLSGYVVKYAQVAGTPKLSRMDEETNYIFVPVEGSVMRLEHNENYLSDGIHGRIMYADGDIYRVLKSHIVTDSSKYLFKPQKKTGEGDEYSDLTPIGQGITNINSAGGVPVIFSLPWRCLRSEWSDKGEELFPYKFATYVDAEGLDAIVEAHRTDGGTLYADWKHEMTESIAITKEVPLYLVKPTEGIEPPEIIVSEYVISRFISEQEVNKDILNSLFRVSSDDPGASSSITGYNANTYTTTEEAYELCPSSYDGPEDTSIIPWEAGGSKYSFELVKCHDIYDDFSVLSTNFQTKRTTVYNLQAIVEAIQELNRRTLFMDTNISFGEAISFNDVAETDIQYASQEKTEDGLPAAGPIPIN